MTKNVLISVKGLQYESGSEEAVEMIAPGEYYLKNGKNYVLYEEITEEEDREGGLSKNTLKFTDDYVEILKRGATNVQMFFAEGKKSHTHYETPFGQLMISTFTNLIEVDDREDVIQIRMKYDLEINQSYVSDCEIKIVIMSKDD